MPLPDHGFTPCSHALSLFHRLWSIFLAAPLLRFYLTYFHGWFRIRATALKCAPRELLFGHQLSRIHFYHSKSFKVINFCVYLKPVYDFLFLFVINYDLSFIFHHFWDIKPQSWKPLNSNIFSPQSRGSTSNFVVNIYIAKRRGIEQLFSENCMYLRRQADNTWISLMFHCYDAVVFTHFR